MIVAGTNLILQLLLPGERAAEAGAVLQKDSHWCAPLLWRSEFRNALSLYVRQKLLTLPDALSIMAEAEAFLAGKEYSIDSDSVLRLATTSPCSAYDCEFVVLADSLGIPLVTSDVKVTRIFSQSAFSPARFLL